jgi:hypothetical protein
MKKILFLLLTLSFVLSSGLYAKDEVKKATVFNPITGERKQVIVGDPNAFQGGFLLEIVEGYELRDENSEELGFSVITSYKTTLSASMTSTQTTVPASSMATKEGTTINMGMIGDKVFLTLEPGGNKEEIVMCTGISASTWTGCTRGLAFYGTSTTAVVANRKTHSAGSVLIMSNVHYVYDELVDKDQAETIGGNKTLSGIWTFGSTTPPVIDSSTFSTSNTAGLITKYQLDNIVNQGAATSTESNAGIIELATRSELSVGTNFDVNNPHTINSNHATTTPGGATYVPVSTEAGYLAQGWLDLSDNFTFTGSTTLNSTTLNATTTINGFAIGDIVVPMTASTTITGVTTPQPVYIASSTAINAGKILLCDSDLPDTSGFVGFAITNGVSTTTSAGKVYVQTDGIVNGFTGLTKGADYYVQSSVGTIGTTIGTYDILVGTAISATELLIRRGAFQYVGSVTVANNASVAIRADAKMLVIKSLTDDGPIDIMSSLVTVLMKNGVTSATVGIRAGDTGSEDVASYTEFTWSGNTLTTNNQNLSGNATVYMYR